MSKKPFMTMVSTAVISAVAALSVPVTSAFAAKGNTVSINDKTLSNSLYAVRMADAPVASFTGNIKGFAATRPRNGAKIDPNSPAVINYKAYLEARHDAALAAVGGARKAYSYGYVFNGFAAELTEAQALKLSQMPGVLGVVKDQFYEVDTATTIDFLGLTAPGNMYAQNFKGENVIIGIVDSGAWPEHPSFSDRTDVNGNGTKDGKLGYQQIPGWNGRCVPGEAFNASNCNQKLIGARFYNEGFGGNAGIDANLPFEFNSPRDHNGHGTHTATTAGGNAKVVTSGAASAFGAINGIAPRARIAAYKACWSVPGTAGSCSGVDLLAAIDQAVADGVDVINYSISGTTTNFRDPVEIAFLGAADAGVFVAASAGNSGPVTSTVAHPSPWITTVAAGTHPRNGSGSVTLGNGATYSGASVATPVPSAPLIDSVAAGLAGADPTQVALCYGAADGAAVLDPAKIAGKIVVCQRGVTARVNKSLAVQQAGGVGMVLFNSPDSSLNADFHFVPTVHVSLASGTAIKAYAAGAGATASIAQAQIVNDLPAPLTASFSSRGPLRAGNGDLLKPDIIAPGQDILAGVAPPNNSGRLFDLYSGTSMSSPHIAGIAALIKSARPTWSPARIKSAIMTTAGDILDGPNTNPLVIFRQGAGHVNPTAALNPGLVFDSGYADWLGFLCGTQLPTSFCTAANVPVLDPSNLNIASIAIGDMPGSQTVTRTVTNVGGKATYTVATTGLVGMTATFSPASFTLNRGESQKIEISFTNSSAALNTYTGGQITWSGGNGERVRIPVVIRPVALGAPTQINSAGNFTVLFGYTGPFTVTPRGLVPSIVDTGSVATNEIDEFQIAVPAGTTYARFSMFDADVSPAADIDLEVYLNGALVGSSGTATSAEEVNLTNPAAGTYVVRAVGYDTGAGAASYKLHSFVLGSEAAGNMAVSAPAAATSGTTGTVSVATSGLAAGMRYMGSIVYGGAAGLPSPTIVRIDN
jgi:Subtilase family/Fibronectin type-III domain/Peptidase inhibitor I9/PA domain